MTNDATRAKAEGLPAITRRTALATTGTALAAALSGFAPHATITPKTTIRAKVEAHAAASRAEHAALAELERLEAANPMPPAQVQCGRLFVGLNDDGTKRIEPLFARSERELERHCKQSLDMLDVFYSRDSPKRDAEVAKIEARYGGLIAELRQKRAERRAARVACGISAAGAEAERLGDIAYEARNAIMGHEYSSLDDLRLAIAHLAQHTEAMGGDPDYEVARLALAFAGIETVEG